MATAFLNFDEPHAWLIRGFVEYGWRDVTKAGGVVPPEAPGGIDVGRIPESVGRDGLILVMRPVADGRACPDPNYEFEVKITGNLPDIKIVVRGADCDYLHEFPYDPANPLYAAGYIHQALTEFVPEFVRWRLQGGELGWTQRSGLPEVAGDPCSGALAQTIKGRLQLVGKTFDSGPAEGWWTGQAAIAGGPQASRGPVATVGEGGGDPVYLSAAARAAIADGAANVERLVALEKVEAPAIWLNVMCYAGIGIGVLGLLNAVYTVYAFGSRQLFAVGFSLAWTILLMGGGFEALSGVKRYKAIRPGWQVWFSLIYCAFIPLCCVAGLPLAVWATVVWTSAEVKAGRLNY